jgi:hypothetical protein
MTTQQTNANARCRLHEQLGGGDESGVMKALCTKHLFDAHGTRRTWWR